MARRPTPPKRPVKKQQGPASMTFDSLLLKGIRSGQIPARTMEARKWFRTEAKKTAVTPSSLIREDASRLKNRLAIGELGFFFYDPKHKKTLPYYDRFPLIFKVGPAKGGFYGINFHYLPLPLRARLMDALYNITSNEKFDQTTKLKLSYGVLKTTTKMRYFKPTFKHYLHEHVRSRFLSVHSSEWDIAIFLPVAQFEKADQFYVWRKSREMLGLKNRKSRARV